MDNTLENAEEFVMEAVNGHDAGKPEAIWFEDVIEILVAYAATIRPAADVVVRVPSERKNLELMQWEKGYNSGWNNCISELRRLNPALIAALQKHIE